MEDQLTEQEQQFINKVTADLEFYSRYKDFMGNVKGIYLERGPEAAIIHIRSHAEFLLGLAVDELFVALFTNL